MSSDTGHEVVIAGAGTAALEALLALRRLAAQRVRVTVVAPHATFTHRPLAVVEPFDLGAVHALALGELCRHHDATFRQGQVAVVDATAQTVTLADGGRLHYDTLLLATGAEHVEAVAGALTYRGEQDVDRVGDLLAALRDRRATRLALVVPDDAGWPLPIYELALTIARWARAAGCDTELVLVTAEGAPLELLGAAGSQAAAGALDAAGVQLRCACRVERVRDGRVWTDLEGAVRADRVIALARRSGRAPLGIPADDRGFVEVDRWCRVRGCADAVLAAGDLTMATVRQDCLSAQQADVAAAVIAADAGAPVQPEPYRPVLRGLLIAAGAPRYLRHCTPLGGGLPDLDHEPLWWPPAGIAGRELTPYLAPNLDLATPEDADTVAVDVAVATPTAPEPRFTCSASAALPR